MEKKPDPELIQLPTSEITQPISTAIYSSNPTFDEWVFRDQLARGLVLPRPSLARLKHLGR